MYELRLSERQLTGREKKCYVHNIILKDIRHSDVGTLKIIDNKYNILQYFHTYIGIILSKSVVNNNYIHNMCIL